jgi:hypothetical protein
MLVPPTDNWNACAPAYYLYRQQASETLALQSRRQHVVYRLSHITGSCINTVIYKALASHLYMNFCLQLVNAFETPKIFWQ